jgi:alcohol dehydrogenase
VIIRAGHTVLTQGTGGVSIFALQFAKLFGARVIATTSSPEKVDRLRALGADHVVNYVECPEWGARVRTLADGRGVDRVVEVGGSGTFPQSLTAVARGGEIVLIGFLSTDNPSIDYGKLKTAGATIRMSAVGPRDGLLELVRAVAMSGLTPVIDRVFDFTEARAAFEHLRSGRHVGKVVIRVAD